MYEVTQEIPFCYGHRLLLHAGKCARLHGHNGVARLTLRAGRRAPPRLPAPSPRAGVRALVL